MIGRKLEGKAADELLPEVGAVGPRLSDGRPPIKGPPGHRELEGKKLPEREAPPAFPGFFRFSREMDRLESLPERDDAEPLHESRGEFVLEVAAEFLVGLAEELAQGLLGEAARERVDREDRREPPVVIADLLDFERRTLEPAEAALERAREVHPRSRRESLGEEIPAEADEFGPGRFVPDQDLQGPLGSRRTEVFVALDEGHGVDLALGIR